VAVVLLRSCGDGGSDFHVFMASDFPVSSGPSLCIATAKAWAVIGSPWLVGEGNKNSSLSPINSSTLRMVVQDSGERGTKWETPFFDRWAGIVHEAFFGFERSASSDLAIPATSPARVPVSKASRSANPTRLDTGGNMTLGQNSRISPSDKTRVPVVSAPRFRRRAHGLP
jgi:hypothetical protein